MLNLGDMNFTWEGGILLPSPVKNTWKNTLYIYILVTVNKGVKYFFYLIHLLF